MLFLFNPSTRARLLFFLSKQGKSFKWKQSAFEDTWTGDPQVGHHLYQGQFSFLGEKLEAATPLFWRHPGVSESFLRKLHDFEWLKDLRSLSLTQARGLARRYILDWIQANQTWHPVVWSPDVTGARMAIWVGLFDFFGSSGDEAFLKAFSRSMTQHMRYLDKLMRFQSAADSVLPALKGLIFTKLSFGQAAGGLLRL